MKQLFTFKRPNTSLVNTMLYVVLLSVVSISSVLAQATQGTAFETYLNNHPYSNRPVLTKSELKKLPNSERPDYRMEFEYMRMVDPSLLRVPLERLDSAYASVAKSLKGQNAAHKGGIPGIDNVNWTERGPNNVGGRTRAIMFDPNDSQHKKVWAGSVAGGLWYNEDITLGIYEWKKVNDFWENLAISSLAYDPTDTQVMYAGTGEFTINSDAVSGGGIWKTTDGGNSWNRLANTIPSGGVGAARNFNWVSKIVVNSLGHVFAGTNHGVYKSIDKGTTWTVVLAPKNNIGGVDLSGVSSFPNTVADIEIGSDDILYVAMGYYSLETSNEQGRIFKSTSSDGTTYTDISPLLTGGRIELALAPSTNGSTQVVYAVAAAGTNGGIRWFKSSNNAGTAWSDLKVPTYADNSVFTGAQSWYDLILAVKPDDPNTVFAGGTSYFRTTNANNGLSATWTILSGYNQYVHPDMHAIVFRPTFSNQIVWGNDGGIYYSDSILNSPSNRYFKLRNTNYNVTQFYGISMKNLADRTYLLGGTQDNGTWHFIAEGVGPGFQSAGGDGMIGAIDQDDANIQIGSYYSGNFYLVDRYGNQGGALGPAGGQFVDPLAYDSKTNTLFSCAGSTAYNTLDRVMGVGSSNAGSAMSLGVNIGGFVSALRIGNSDNTLFIATRAGRIYKVTNTHLNNATSVRIDKRDVGIGQPTANISCIEVGATDNEILVTYSNYGVKSIWYTADGGTTWVSKDETTHGLPDMPIRWALMNPNNRQQVLIATEVGVWSTNNITDVNPEWTVTNNGLANVRSDMLTYREADGLVAIATHGRGLFTTDAFAVSNKITINNPPINIAVACNAQNLSLPLTFQTTGTFDTNNTFTVELSDEKGMFNTPTALGQITQSNNGFIFPATTLNSGFYQVRIKSSNPVVYAYSDFYITKKCNYCTDLNSDCSYADYISNVKLLDNTTPLINNSSTCGGVGFTDYTSTVAVANVTAGNTYSLSFNTANTELDGITAWLDFNKDNVFSTNEIVYIDSDVYVDNGTPRIGNFTVPAFSENGNVRLRVRLNYGNVISNSCGELSYGETEDYLVNISGGVISPGIQSIHTGDWHNPSTWNCACIPSKADEVTINAGHTVLINNILASVKKVIFMGGNIFFVNNGFLMY